MKKVMMMMVACALFAGTASAALVTWGTGTVAGLSGWQGQTVSFYLCADGYDLGASGGVIDALKKDGVASLPGGADFSKVISSKNSAAGDGTKNDFNPGDIAYGWAVVFSSDGKQFAIFDVKASDPFPGAGDTALNFGGVYTVYDVVPEPTAAALLALGVAAVGLRRRFAK